MSTSPDTPSGRALRLCDVCGQLDTHPRHVTNVREGGRPRQAFLDGLPEGVPTAALVEVLDPTSVVRHLDCCAAQGCPSCPQVLASAGEAHGDDLVRYLTRHLSGQEA